MKVFATLTTLLLAIASTVAQTVDPIAIEISRAGSRPSTPAPAQNFTGAVRVDPLFAANAPARASAAYVTFEPGAHTAWHTHPLGQRLVVTAGVGRVQRWGGPVEEIRPGDVVWIPPGQKHWHGAAPTGSMKHVAIQENVDGKTVDWLEKVSDEQYRSAPPPSADASEARTTGAASAGQPSIAQRQFGDIAPKLAQLTDDMLFGDVWERPGLSKRDRSLATVSALIAMNRPEQLRAISSAPSRTAVFVQRLTSLSKNFYCSAGASHDRDTYRLLPLDQLGVLPTRSSH